MANNQDNQDDQTIPRQPSVDPDQDLTVEEIQDTTTQAVEGMAKKEQHANNPGSLRSKMASSLRFFAPDLVGGLVGGLLGGVEGASAGMGEGQKIRKDLTNTQLQLAQLDLQSQQFNRASRADDIYDKRTGETLFSNGFGKITNQQGEVVDPKFQGNRRDNREGRLRDQGDRSRDQRDVSLKITKDKFVDKVGEDAEKKKLGLIKDVESNKVYQQAEQSVAEVASIRALVSDAVNEGGPVLSALGNRMARFMGEVGVLTEEDVKRYIQNPSIEGIIKDGFNKLKAGKLSGDTAEDLRRLLGIIEKEQVGKQKFIVDKLSKRRSKATSDFNNEEALDIIGPIKAPKKDSGVVLKRLNGKVYRVDVKNNKVLGEVK